MEMTMSSRRSLAPLSVRCMAMQALHRRPCLDLSSSPTRCCVRADKKTERTSTLPGTITAPNYDIGTAPHKPRELIDFELRMPPHVREDFQAKVQERCVHVVAVVVHPLLLSSSNCCPLFQSVFHSLCGDKR